MTIDEQLGQLRALGWVLEHGEVRNIDGNDAFCIDLEELLKKVKRVMENE